MFIALSGTVLPVFWWTPWYKVGRLNAIESRPEVSDRRRTTNQQGIAVLVLPCISLLGFQIVKSA